MYRRWPCLASFLLGRDKLPWLPCGRGAVGTPQVPPRQRIGQAFDEGLALDILEIDALRRIEPRCDDLRQAGLEFWLVPWIEAGANRFARQRCCGVRDQEPRARDGQIDVAILPVVEQRHHRVEEF